MTEQSQANLPSSLNRYTTYTTKNSEKLWKVKDKVNCWCFLFPWQHQQPAMTAWGAQSTPAMEPSNVRDGAAGAACKPRLVCLFCEYSTVRSIFFFFFFFGEVPTRAQIGRVKATKRSTAAAHADSLTLCIKLLLLLHLSLSLSLYTYLCIHICIHIHIYVGMQISKHFLCKVNLQKEICAALLWRLISTSVPTCA